MLFLKEKGNKEILIEAGVIKETRVPGFPMKPFLLQEEKGGGRCRVITDVPNLNELIRGKVPARLPYVVHMYGEILKAMFVVAIDFKCFYFQLGRRAAPERFPDGGNAVQVDGCPHGGVLGGGRGVYGEDCRNSAVRTLEYHLSAQLPTSSVSVLQGKSSRDENAKRHYVRGGRTLSMDNLPGYCLFSHIQHSS